MAVQYKRKKAKVIQTPEEDDKLPGKPWPPFIYAWHPQSYEVVDGEWLPVLKPIFAVPGVNGCKVVTRKGKVVRIVAGPMKAAMEEKGWRFLDERTTVAVSRDGELVDEVGYLDEIEGHRGTFYCSVWWTLEVQGYGKNAHAVKGEFDRAGYDATRRRLLEDGTIPPVSPGVIGRKLDRARDRAARSGKLAHDGAAPGLKARAEREAERLAEVETATEKATGKKAAPKRRSTARRKRSTAKVAEESA
jgi:hypothetical protein